jgi:hypothetical protein
VVEIDRGALSYYDHNLLEIDWDAALLIDEPKELRRFALHYRTGEFPARRPGSVRRHPRRPAGPRLPRSARTPEPGPDQPPDADPGNPDRAAIRLTTQTAFRNGENQ